MSSAPSMRLIVDTGHLVENWRDLARISGVETAAVVKADGYGLGVATVSRPLWEAGARQFFVATADEAHELRTILPDAEIYELSGLSVFEPAQARIFPVINSRAQLNALNGRPFALQFDTGMSRLGLDIKDLPDLSHLKPQLVMSHLASSDDPHSKQNQRQLQLFLHVASAFPMAKKSLSATGGIYLGADFQFDIVRPGIGLYGGAPFMDAKPVAQLELPVIQTRDIQAGTSIGYEETFKATKPMKLATLLGGYADGVPRSLSNQANFYHENQACPILGRVSMDSIVVDISALSHPPKSLSLFHKSQSLNDIALKTGTIAYEILTGLGSRFERVEGAAS